MVAYSKNQSFFGVLEAIDFLVFFDFCAADGWKIGMVCGGDSRNYIHLNLKIKHF